MEKILEEQIERMRQLTERMSEIRREVVRNTEFISQHRRAPAGPLGEYRDYRTLQSPAYPEPRGDQGPNSNPQPRRAAANRKRRHR